MLYLQNYAFHLLVLSLYHLHLAHLYPLRLPENLRYQTYWHEKRTGFRLYVEDFVLKVVFILRFKITFLSDVALIFSIFWLLIVVLVLFRRNDDDLTKKYSLFSNFLVETSHSYHLCSYNFPNISSQQKSPLFFYSLCMCYLYRC